VRELIHNAVQHGKPTLVHLRVRCVQAEIRVEIEDNGCGFDPSCVKEGRGLTNVRERMNQIGGGLEVSSPRTSGSLVVLRAPLESIPAATKPGL
jgi:signal transduction histidine kinase